MSLNSFLECVSIRGWVGHPAWTRRLPATAAKQPQQSTNPTHQHAPFPRLGLPGESITRPVRPPCCGCGCGCWSRGAAAHCCCCCCFGIAALGTRNAEAAVVLSVWVDGFGHACVHTCVPCMASSLNPRSAAYTISIQSIRSIDRPPRQARTAQKQRRDEQEEQPPGRRGRRWWSHPCLLGVGLATCCWVERQRQLACV